VPDPIPWESIARTAREVRSPTPTDAEALLQQLSPENLDREGFLQVWQPQPDESAQEYLAFSLYRDQGPDRTLPKGPMPRERLWQPRALAYDQWLDQQPRSEQVTADQIARSLLNTMQLIGHQFQLEAMKLLAQQIQHPACTLPELVKAIESLAKTSRLLTNRTTENMGVGVFDLTKLSTEDLLDWERLQKKALPGGGE
jgi:hypothetical protein